MIINKIEIENFRSIKKKISIDSSTSAFKSFIGPNNSGKSNILRALNLFFNLETEPGIPFNPKQDIALGSNKSANINILFHFTKSIDNNIVNFIDKNYSATFKEYNVLLSLRLYANGSTQYIFTTGKGQKSTGMVDLRLRILDYINCIYIPAIKDYRNIINKDMMRKIVASTFQGWGKGRISKKLGENKENFVKIMESLQQILNISGDSMTEMFRDVVPSIERFDFSLPYDNLEDLLGRLSFQISESGINEQVSLDNEGSGIQSYTIYSMLKLLHELRPTNTYKKSKFIWLIEEPETFMHHDLQRKTFNKLKKYSQEGHIFISTHSPIFIDKIDYSNSFLITKDIETIVSKVTTNNIRSIITGSLGVRFDELGLFNRFNILVEGETDKKILLELNKLFKIIGKNDLLDENETEIIVCGSASSIPHFYLMYNAFNQYGSFYALFDRDRAGINARDSLLKNGIAKDLLILIPESDFKSNGVIEDLVDKESWDKCLGILDGMGLITIKQKKNEIVDYEYLPQDRVKVKKEFTRNLIKLAKADMKPFHKYLDLLRTFSTKFNNEKI